MLRQTRPGRLYEVDRQRAVGDDERLANCEGVGVTPDVEVENLPHETFHGRDRQLDVAIELLRQKIKEQPVGPYKPAGIPALKR